jgi:hypothetical protein
VVIGFNIRAARGLDESAEKRGVVIRYFSIIYDLVDSVKALMAGKLPSILEEVVIGRAEVRQSISVPKFGTIAGSAVIDGRITRSSSLRLTPWSLMARPLIALASSGTAREDFWPWLQQRPIGVSAPVVPMAAPFIRLKDLKSIPGCWSDSVD